MTRKEYARIYLERVEQDTYVSMPSVGKRRSRLVDHVTQLLTVDAGNRTIANEICDYLGAERRGNRSEIERALNAVDEHYGNIQFG